MRILPIREDAFVARAPQSPDNFTREREREGIKYNETRRTPQSKRRRNFIIYSLDHFFI